MDYVEQLPPSHGFDAILVVVDRLTKMAVFIPTHTATNAKELAQLYFRHVFSKHGAPSDIVSDRGNKFTSAFWSALMTVLGVKQNLSTAYHPQTDGQTERVNQTMEQHIRMYCSYDQDDWAQWLPMAEFAYNNAEHATTGMSPFFANYGYNPTFEVSETPPDVSGVSKESLEDFVKQIHQAQQDAKEAMAASQATYKDQADHRKSEGPDLKPGDKVWLSAENIRTTRPARKFAEKHLGPFPVKAKISATAYRLELPATLKKIHPVFHISLLEKVRESEIPNRQQQRSLPVVAAEDEECEVEEILDSRRRRQRLEYKVLWKVEEGHPQAITWEPASNLEGSPDLVAAFHRTFPDKPHA